MTREEERELIDDLAVAISSIDLTDREMADLRLLYQSTAGFPYELDVRSRPQGATIRSSSTVGSKIMRALNVSSGYGMNWVGYGDQKKCWHMTSSLRAAIDQTDLLGFGKVEVDATDTDDGSHSVENVAETSATNDESTVNTEREQLVMARVGQGLFRSRVETNDPSCRITGVTDSRFLRASHIKPWAASTDLEKLDGENGLMLSPHADHLFDQGFISFNDDGSLLLSAQLSPTIIAAWSFPLLIAPQPLASKQSEYMEYHRTHIFKP